MGRLMNETKEQRVARADALCQMKTQDPEKVTDPALYIRHCDGANDSTLNQSSTQAIGTGFAETRSLSPTTQRASRALHAHRKTSTLVIGSDLPDQVVNVHIEGARQIIESVEACTALRLDH